MFKLEQSSMSKTKKENAFCQTCIVSHTKSVYINLNSSVHLTVPFASFPGLFSSTLLQKCSLVQVLLQYFNSLIVFQSILSLPCFGSQCSTSVVDLLASLKASRVVVLLFPETCNHCFLPQIFWFHFSSTARLLDRTSDSSGQNDLSKKEGITL